MPNMIMEYSNSVDERVNVQCLLEDLHHIAIESGLFDINSIKSRAARYHNWLIGQQDDNADFIHLRVELLSGRSDQQKEALAQQLLKALQQHASEIYSLTIDIQDMNRTCFAKAVNKT